MKKWYIGNLEIKGNLVLAPMAGYTDLAFRRLCKEYGCDLVISEMISDRAIIYENKKTIAMLQMCEYERPFGLQLFGDSPETLSKACKLVEKYIRPDFININMGCPVKKIAIKSKAGSSLMKEPQLIVDIIKACKEAVKIPVTIKIRTGWDKNSINCLEIAKMAEEAGVDAIFIHGRTREQGYTGLADWDLMLKVKSLVNVPVIANGDIVDIESYLNKQCDKFDAIMIGRGALGKPYIFKEIKNRKNPNLSPKEIIDIVLKHIQYALESKEEYIVSSEMKGIVQLYLKGLNNIKTLKVAVAKSNNVEAIIKLLNDYKNQC